MKRSRCADRFGEIKQNVVGQCSQAILLADHTKFGERSLYKVLDIEQIHTVVTDELTPAGQLAELEQRHRRVLVVAVPSQAGTFWREGVAYVD